MTHSAARDSDRRTAKREVERLCARATDGRELRAGVVEVLRRAIGLDWYVWALTDPVTGVGVDPLADTPDLRELPTLVRLKYATATNRWTTLADVGDVATLGSATTSSALWREVQAAHGVVDVLSAVCRDRHGTWAFLDLWSTSEMYAADDVALVRDLLPVVTSAIRAERAATFGLVPAERRPGGAVGPAVLLLDDDLTVTGRTPSSDAWLTRLLPTEPGKSPVPAAALNVAAQLLAVESGVDDHAPHARAHVAGGVWVTLRASRLDPERQIAVTIEVTSPQERLDLFARAHGLSAREREVVAVLATGADTATAAGRLFVSPHTVQDHLKAVFAKAHVHSRRDLLTQVLGGRPGD